MTGGGGRLLASGQTLKGSFSAVSTATIARVGIFSDFSRSTIFSPLRTALKPKFHQKTCQNFTQILQKFTKFRSNFAKFQRNFIGISPKFHRICEIHNQPSARVISREQRAQSAVDKQKISRKKSSKICTRPVCPN